jgi:hypothetical protein
MAIRKRRMTEEQEFEIMKLVLDKFLWLGFIVMGWGMFTAIRDSALLPGLWYMFAGAILLVLFMIIVVKEYEVIK